MHVFHKPEALGATAHVLRVLQPEWQSGEPVTDEVEEVLQALCLRPYTGHESAASGGHVNRKAVRRYAVLEDDIEKVPMYELAAGKFS